MKRLLAMMLSACAALSVCAEIAADELVELALKDAVAAVQGKLAGNAAVPDAEPVAILPLGGDAKGNLIGLVKNALTEAGKTCVEGKEDPMWEAILKEIAWDERKEDILDPATLDRFGSLKSARYLMYGSIRRLAASERSVLVELELHVSCIATKQHVWGDVFVRRHYAPGSDPKGAIKIPAQVRVAIIDGLRAKIADSLAKSKRLGNVKKVAILPIAGDVDQYGEGLFRDVLAASSLTPVNLDVMTRAEARFALRESSGNADAIAYGALRDIDVRLVETAPGGIKTYRALAELQLWIEKGATREIVWSDTVQFAKEFATGPRSWWDRLCHFFPIVGEHPSLAILIPVALLVALILLKMFLKAATRVR